MPTLLIHDVNFGSVVEAARMTVEVGADADFLRYAKFIRLASAP